LEHTFEIKKAYIKEVGWWLIKLYGKNDFYSSKEVYEAHLKALEKRTFKESSVVWAMSIFCSEDDFNIYSFPDDESYIYIDIRSEILIEIMDSNIDLPSIVDLEIDGSWLDFGEIFEGVFEGIGSFISAIFE